MDSKVEASVDDMLGYARVGLASHQFELDRVRGQILTAKLHLAELQATNKIAISQLTRVKSTLEQSRWINLARRVAKCVHGLRGRGKFVDPFDGLKIPPMSPPVKIGQLPVLPPDILRALDIPQSVVDPPKEWARAEFRSFYYYNEIERILSRPESRGRPVFIQSPIIDWFVPLYQRPQHLAMAMARRGYLVFYMTANTLGDHAAGFHEIEDNVFITNQPVHQMVDNALISFYSTVATLAAWQGGEIEALKRRGSKIVYEYIDHIDPEISFGTTDALTQQFELVSDATVDLVVASAQTLIEEISAKVDRTPVAYVQNGVDTEHYRKHLANNRLIVPEAMREVVGAGRPIVGYFGALAPWLWYPILNQLARRRPDLSFVYIGPDYLSGSEQLELGSNVYALGAIDYSALPYYAQHFDVATIPFKPGDIAKTTSPLKLFEYFALGVPVVVTRGMRECERYDLVLTASSVEEFSSAVDTGIVMSSGASFRESSSRLAEENSWLARAATLAEAHASIMRL